jgi:hypothetical protein
MLPLEVTSSAVQEQRPMPPRGATRRESNSSASIFAKLHALAGCKSPWRRNPNRPTSLRRRQPRHVRVVCRPDKFARWSETPCAGISQAAWYVRWTHVTCPRRREALKPCVRSTLQCFRLPRALLPLRPDQWSKSGSGPPSIGQNPFITQLPAGVSPPERGRHSFHHRKPRPFCI